jgi:hypothetical protein
LDIIPGSDAELTSAEHKQLSTSAGVIIHENSDGFVDVRYYDTVAALMDAWKQITGA